MLADFVWVHKDLVDEDISTRFFKGDQTAVTEALNQIHWRSMKLRGGLNWDTKDKIDDVSSKGRRGAKESSRENVSNGKNFQAQQWKEKDWANKLGCRSKLEWEEVIATSLERWEEVVKEANPLKALMDREAMEALDSGNTYIQICDQ